MCLKKVKMENVVLIFTLKPAFIPPGTAEILVSRFRCVWQSVYTIHSTNQSQTLKTWKDCDYGPNLAHSFLKFPKPLLVLKCEQH